MAEDEKGTESKSAKQATTYEAARLIEEAPAFLGVPSHVAAGALHGGKKVLTVDEADAAIQKWLTKPVT